jgi:hypothetical protein
MDDLVRIPHPIRRSSDPDRLIRGFPAQAALLQDARTLPLGRRPEKESVHHASSGSHGQTSGHL